MLARSLLLLLATASLTTAHFILEWPETAGFDDDAEPTNPCGGATVVVNSSAPAISVDRFTLSILSTHPAGSWSFSATTDTAAPYSFTNIARISTTGAGNFCLTNFTVPADFAGKTGVIQVVDDSIDGTLYQCAPVSFVSGFNVTEGPTCTNTSSTFSANWLSVDREASTSGSPSTTSASSTGASASAASASSTSHSSTGAAAIATGMAGGIVGGIMLAAGLVL